jgi:hypothetical protein
MCEEIPFVSLLQCTRSLESPEKILAIHDEGRERTHRDTIDPAQSSPLKPE